MKSLPIFTIFALLESVWNLNICRKFEFVISQGSVATCIRWGKNVYVFHTISSSGKTFSKSVKIWQSYRELKCGNAFWDTYGSQRVALSLTALGEKPS